MKRVLILFLPLILLLTSCAAMSSYVPAAGDTVSVVLDHLELFQKATEETERIAYDCTITSTVYYKAAEAADLSGLYILNVKEKKAEKYTSLYFSSLAENCSVKLIDLVRRGSLSICSFGMTRPGSSFDYGVYYVSEDKPIYIGDPTVSLTEKGNGFSCVVSASYGSSFSFYTEKIAPNYYYYEIN